MPKRSQDPITASKHHVHMSFHQFRHQASYTPYLNDTPLPLHPAKTGLDSALALILQITRWTASQAALDSPLSPLCGLKPHCRGVDAPEHSGHRAVTSCWEGLEEADTTWPPLIRWCWGIDRRAAGASCLKIPGIKIRMFCVRAPGKAKNNISLR